MVVRRNAIRRKASEAPVKEKEERHFWRNSWLDEAAALLCLALALILLLSFFSHAVSLSRAVSLHSDLAAARANLMGPVGHILATLLFGFMGWCALVPVACLLWFSIYLWRHDQEERPTGLGLSWHSPAGFLGVLIFSAALVSVFAGSAGGGSLGNALATPLVRFLNVWGAALVAFSLLVLSITLTTSLGALEIARNFTVAVLWLGMLVVHLPFLLYRVVRLCTGAVAGRIEAGLRAWVFRREKASGECELPAPRRRRNVFPPEQEKEVARPVAAESEEEPEAPPEESGGETEVDEDGEEYTHVVVSRRAPQRVLSEKRSSKAAAKERAEREAAAQEWEERFKGYELPAVELLSPGETSPGGEDDEELLEKSRLIESKLRDFGVLGRVTEVHPGPVITLFEFEPAPGVKVGRVAALSDDLAMSLKATSIRIIAPIPKRGTVGIEIPNRHRDLVRLRDVLESEAFAACDSVLSVCVGKDTYGDPVVVDIASMPHLLMAGATGTGKSVCINAFLLSLLYRARPSELGLILIDPKILELSVYEGIPHLRVPVVVNPKQARAVLQWAVDEMHRRYRLIQKFGVRNIDGYNRIVKGEAPAEGEENLTGAPKVEEDVVILTDEAVVEEGTVERPAPRDEDAPPVTPERLRPLPKILIVIDEVADLMLSVGRDIEELVTRLAQKARAAGIHLIIATQRPSVDVVTGLIKANFPARLSFRVTSRIDSRTILDSMGAEKLLGRGDMLFMQPGGEALRRVHGAFVSDNEVKRVVTAVKEQCTPQYDDRIMQICEKALEEEEQQGSNSGSGTAVGEDEYDPVYDKAVELVVEKGHASTSMIQRVFRIGYNRAARIVELMEKEGIVGPMDGAKPREVLLPKPETIEEGQ